MNYSSTHPPKSAVDLRHLPPIDPFLITNSSYEGKKLNNTCTRTVAKPSPNQGMKLRHSDKPIVKNSTSGNLVVDDASNKKTETCGSTISPSHTHSADEGMKKGTARSNLYEICAAKHWKPPIFECCKEEGPSHKRMYVYQLCDI